MEVSRISCLIHRALAGVSIFSLEEAEGRG